jgi:hypothetical protein
MKERWREINALRPLYEEQIGPLKLEVVSNFARSCCVMEGGVFERCVTLDSVTEETVGGSNQRGVYQVYATKSDCRVEFIVKCGRSNNEFLCSQLFQPELLKKEAPCFIKFAYPRYMQDVSMRRTGKLIDVRGRPLCQLTATPTTGILKLSDEVSPHVGEEENPLYHDYFCMLFMG